ncbi:NAD(P)-binding protein [Gonapodya prolifera JEL478]|uniref:NAD(P)-binding protein n=1 Tax=Gonapodya prolifera (strain JEL478) TaxID=1344416 RepID=A0A139AHC5_GONPJ|nr:NAD(P)-binding protein [Gonapodya prolifera JEL478]|eukprot:KXS16160.1 NAD(P)-binding protein [Gonapodya prolifera JEL478]
MAESNRISNVAIVGAGGNVGKNIAEALLATKNFSVSALTRPNSPNSVPDGAIAKPVDYDVFSTLVDALRGQDVLIITLSVAAPPDTQEKLIRAAGEAGVKWILPNAWGGSSEAIHRDMPMFPVQSKAWALISEIGKSSYIAVGTGFWYEWSLAIHDAFGFDFANKKVILYDDGNTKLPISTWPQVGRAVASLLSLPISDKAKGPSLDMYRNSQVFINSFFVSQNDMFESVLRVTATKREDWTVTFEPSAERFKTNMAELATGNRRAFGRALYARAMYPDGSGNFLKSHTTINDVLGLPTEDIDDATRAAIKRSQEVDPWGHAGR